MLNKPLAGPRNVFSGTQEPYLSNVIIKEDRVPTSQILWEARSLTNIDRSLPPICKTTSCHKDTRKERKGKGRREGKKEEGREGGREGGRKEGRKEGIRLFEEMLTIMKTKVYFSLLVFFNL